MNKASLFIGRWQPFHAGHKKLIETVLKKGKPAVVAIRNTEMTKENPYSVNERWEMIARELKEYGSLVRIVILPNDIDEVCIGREVGYAIRKIDLDAKTEKISGTKIRKETLTLHPIYWITGQSGSGKTTLARALQEEIGGTLLDGDEMRESISLGLGFSKEDREEHNIRVARLALTLRYQGPVIVSVIAPFESTRRKIEELIKPLWIYIKKDIPMEKDKPYEVPMLPTIIVDSDKQTVKEEVETIMKYVNSFDTYIKNKKHKN